MRTHYHRHAHPNPHPQPNRHPQGLPLSASLVNQANYETTRNDSLASPPDQVAEFADHDSSVYPFLPVPRLLYGQAFEINGRHVFRTTPRMEKWLASVTAGLDVDETYYGKGNDGVAPQGGQMHRPPPPVRQNQEQVYDQKHAVDIDGQEEQKGVTGRNGKTRRGKNNDCKARDQKKGSSSTVQLG